MQRVRRGLAVAALWPQAVLLLELIALGIGFAAHHSLGRQWPLALARAAAPG